MKIGDRVQSGNIVGTIAEIYEILYDPTCPPMVLIKKFTGKGERIAVIKDTVKVLTANEWTKFLMSTEVKNAKIYLCPRCNNNLAEKQKGHNIRECLGCRM